MPFNYFKRYPIFFFLILAIVIRILTLFPTVIDHDEATYLVIANEWLKGNIPFVRYADIKPIGIYALYASVIACFGQSVEAIRLFTSIVIGITAYFLFEAKQKEGASSITAAFVGVFYCLILSIDHWGWASNTEIFFNLFTSIALLLLIKRPNISITFFIGLFMGLGFIIKYHILFDSIAFGLVYLIQNKHSFRKQLSGVTLMLIGGVLPFLIINLVYYFSGYYESFFYVSFVIPSRYHVSSTILEKALFVGKFHLFFLPLLVLNVLGTFRLYQQKLMSTEKWILRVLWPVLVWCAILMTGQTFKHYYLQAVLPFCFCSFDYFELMKQTQRKYSILRYSFLVLAVVLGISCIISQYISLYNKDDFNKQVIEKIKEDFDTSVPIYSEQMVLHFLLNSSPVQQFIHPSLYSVPSHIEAFGIDVEKSFKEIREAKVQYIFCSKDRTLLFKEKLTDRYVKVGDYPRTYSLWKRKETIQ